MTQISFSKQDPTETLSRLKLLGSSRGAVTIWQKGQKTKYNHTALKFYQERMEVVIDSLNPIFPKGSVLLCSFELRGVNYFSEVVFETNPSGNLVLEFKNPLYRSEKRAAYRLLAYPTYQIWAEFEIKTTYAGGKVVELKSKINETALFKNFLKLIEELPSHSSNASHDKIKIRIQDLSATGFAMHVGTIESEYFKKDMSFEKMNIFFSDERIEIPEAKVVYAVDLINADKKNERKTKVGVHFENLPPTIDEKLSAKINKLLREVDPNKDFENFLK
jgi:hypothetical protein